MSLVRCLLLGKIWAWIVDQTEVRFSKLIISLGQGEVADAPRNGEQVIVCFFWLGSGLRKSRVQIAARDMRGCEGFSRVFHKEIREWSMIIQVAIILTQTSFQRLRARPSKALPREY